MTQIHVRPEKLFQLSRKFTHYAEEVKHVEQKLDSNYQSIPWSVKAKSVVDQYWYEARRQMNVSMQVAHTLARSLEEIANKFLEVDNQGTEKVTSEMKQNAKEKKEEGFWESLKNKAEDFLDKATDKLEEISDYMGDKVSDVRDSIEKGADFVGAACTVATNYYMNKVENAFKTMNTMTNIIKNHYIRDFEIKVNALRMGGNMVINHYVNEGKKLFNYVTDPDGLLTDVSTYAGYAAAGLGFLSVATLWFPPAAGAFAIGSTAAGLVALGADSILYFLDKKDGTAVAADFLGVIPGVATAGKTIQTLKTFTATEKTIGYWLKRGMTEKEAIEQVRDNVTGLWNSTFGMWGATRDSTPK